MIALRSYVGGGWASGTGPAGVCTGLLWGAGACSNSTTCGTCTQDGKCCSGQKCEAHAFPTCRAVKAGVQSVCQACDLLRADHCNPAGGCACGTHNECSEKQFCSDGGCVQ